jgi:hypothetical protein
VPFRLGLVLLGVPDLVHRHAETIRSLDNGEPVGNRLHNVIGIDSMPSQALQVCQASALPTHFYLRLKEQSPWMSQH